MTRHLTALVLLVLAGCDAEPQRYRPLTPGDPAPVYAAPVLGGDTVTLAELLGRPVMLNVWATWCPPCREEMPELQALHERYADRGFVLLGVSVDTRGSERAIREFLEENDISFTILHDAADVVSRQFRTIGVPETFLIDADGRVVRRWIGRFEPLAPDVLSEVEALLPH